uniref:Deoxynucleotidyltransferase terminal-interacting protein 1 n=1 Tax=Athene cunicularia TaxID=194338 RepID=A0A663NAS0_ATHCN
MLVTPGRRSHRQQTPRDTTSPSAGALPLCPHPRCWAGVSSGEGERAPPLRHGKALPAPSGGTEGPRAGRSSSMGRLASLDTGTERPHQHPLREIPLDFISQSSRNSQGKALPAKHFTDPAVSMDLLRAVLQPSINEEIRGVFNKYMKVRAAGPPRCPLPRA